MTDPAGPIARAPARRATGWVPDQHGAWAMLVVPVLAGIWLVGPASVHLALGAFWFVGYLAFYALGRWLRSRRKRRELLPLLVYGALAAPLGIMTLLLAPHLVRWVPVYLPLLAVSTLLMLRRQERSLGNDVVTVLAAGLMAPVVVDAAGGSLGAATWVATGALTAYFLGTVPYVKTMIRERGRAAYVRGSVGYHLVGTVGAAVLAATGWQSWWLVAVWVLLTARAVAGPMGNARRARPLRPVVVGVGEIVASVLVLVTVLVGLPNG
ncbi:MAG: YwiC-like family protein [Nitriliruptoraceae bacterium]